MQTIPLPIAFLLLLLHTFAQPSDAVGESCVHKDGLFTPFDVQVAPTTEQGLVWKQLDFLDGQYFIYELFVKGALSLFPCLEASKLRPLGVDLFATVICAVK